LPAQRQGHVGGAAAQVERARAGALQDFAEEARRPPPPQLVDVEGEQVVEQIVAGRDGGEHRAHRLRRLLGIGDAGGSGAAHG
jgi:hypothetical protein